MWAVIAGGIGRRPHLSEVWRPCVCSWDYITTPERVLPDGHARCNTSRGKASELGSELPGFRDSRGVAPSAPLSCYVLTQMGRVNRSGVKPCGRSILMEQNPGPQWIRLMPACGGREGAGVSARSSPTGVDGLGLCRWLMVARGWSDEGKEGRMEEKRWRPAGADRAKDQQSVDKGLSCLLRCS